MKMPVWDLWHVVPLKSLPIIVLAITLGTTFACRSVDAEATVKTWVEALANGDMGAARATYDPEGWPDGYSIWERDFAMALAASAQVSYENQATFASGRAQIVVRTRTDDLKIAWIFKLRQTKDKEWAIVNILRYFE